MNMGTYLCRVNACGSLSQPKSVTITWGFSIANQQRWGQARPSTYALVPKFPFWQSMSSTLPIHLTTMCSGNCPKHQNEHGHEISRTELARSRIGGTVVIGLAMEARAPARVANVK